MYLNYVSLKAKKHLQVAKCVLVLSKRDLEESRRHSLTNNFQ